MVFQFGEVSTSFQHPLSLLDTVLSALQFPQEDDEVEVTPDAQVFPRAVRAPYSSSLLMVLMRTLT